MAAKPVVWTFYLCLGLFYAATGDKVAQKIYKNLTGIMPCVILTNATNQIGCTSSMNGHVGVLHYVEDKSDVEWILEKGKHKPYIPLFRSDQFDLELLRPLIENKKISGALAIAIPSGQYRHTPEKVFSPDYACPNDHFGAYNGNSEYGNCQKVEWNKGGNAMSFKYYDIPMFALNDENEINATLECYWKYNSQPEPDYPLCAVQLKDFMYAAKDTPTCMRKTKMPNPTGSEFCQPLGDMNVWGTLYPIKEPLKDPEVVMLAAKLDSSSFFHDMSPGVDNDGTGIIVALAAAKALGALKRNGSVEAPKNPIMFTFFQGETWDYIGSSRMVYDMEHNDFPNEAQAWKVGSDGSEKIKMKTTNIKYFLELNQVGLNEDGDSLWAHSDPVSRSEGTDAEVTKMVTALQEAGSNYKLNIQEPSGKQPLPPASFQRFLRHKKTVPGIVLTDHQDQYTNKFYNSHFDDLHQVGGTFPKENDTVYLITNFTKRLAKIAATVATALYTLANDGQPPKYEIKLDNDTEAVIGHLAYCFFIRSNCPLYREVFEKKAWESLKQYKPFPLPFPRYVSVNSSTNTFTTTISYLLLYFTGLHWSPGNKKCSTSEGVVTANMQGKDLKGICVSGSVFLSPALSPAFLLEKYDSTEYSTWAESTWGDDLTVRLFLVASPQLEGVTLGAGLIITVVSFVLVYFINKKADTLFTPIDPLSADGDS